MTPRSEAHQPYRRVAPVGLVLTVLWLVFATGAVAGPPNHLQREPGPIGGFALDHACGTATDSEGNIYVANAGEDQIEVFDSSGAHLKSISNVNAPCGLAVDGDGNLYVSERGSGEVVRYEPPTYGVREVIDSSGDAKGIAVDPSDDRLYVAEGDRVTVYDSQGTLGINEVQRVLCFEASGGFYRLEFNGEPSAPIPCETTAEVVKERLEELASIDPGDVSVEHDGREHFVTFTGNYARTDVEALIGDPSELTGPEPDKKVVIEEKVKGWGGHVGEGELTEATGVAAYTYKISNEKATRYVYVADASGDELKLFSGSDIRDLKLRRTISGVDHDNDPGTSSQQLEFGPTGAHLAVDPGNRASDDSCDQVDEQACTAGHLLLYDDAADAVEEFDASGEFLDRIESEDFEDAEPTGMAVDRSGGANDGTIYVTAGAGTGARLLAFAPLVTPSRPLLQPPKSNLSQVLPGAKAVATDPYGNVYVVSGPNIRVFDAEGSALTTIPDPEDPFDLAVDSQCNVYVVDGNPQGEGVMTYYNPPACPPAPGATYVRQAPPVLPLSATVTGVAVNPVDDHVFVSRAGFPAPIAEFGSAEEESGQLGECGAGLSGAVIDLAVHGGGSSGQSRVYLSLNPDRLVGIDCDENEVVAETTGGGGCPSGQLDANSAIAVDQSNGHLVQFKPGQAGGAREYDAALSCVAEYNGSFAGGTGRYAIAIDNGENSPNRGNVYVAFDSLNASQPFDLTAFGPLSYGEAPQALSGVADGIGAAAATLHGSVNPNGFVLEECRFEYLTDDAYEQNKAQSKPLFEGATSQSCAESLATIGNGTDPVAVHADLSGLSPSPQTDRYRFRLLAKNKFGASDGGTGLFGPPRLTSKEAQPVFYDEATFRASVDSSGLQTTYRFQYGSKGAGEYDQATPPATLEPGDGEVAVQVPVTGLAEGTTYHFRALIENEAKTIEGPDQTFTTQKRPAAQSCPNLEYRVGPSTFLPDCRAYELVTPAETRGQTPTSFTRTGDGKGFFSTSFVTPRGAGAGNSVAYGILALPGFDGTGRGDSFRADRGAGAHPVGGWVSDLYGLSFAQIGGSSPARHGISPDLGYWLMDVAGIETPSDENFPVGNYLRVPAGDASPACSPDPALVFELVGCGEASGATVTDPEALGRYVSPGGEHVILVSKAHLADGAPPAGTSVLYDREAGSSKAKVIAVGGGFTAATEDGATVLVGNTVGKTLYRDGQSIQVASGSSASFAGLSADGGKVFYAGGSGPSDLFVCDTRAGSCIGSEPPGLTKIASNSIFINVSPDGSHAYFSSKDALPGADEVNQNGEQAEAGKRNLYAWEESDPTDADFVGWLTAADFSVPPAVSGEPVPPPQHLGRWIEAIDGQGSGRALSPTRSSLQGGALAFESYARLTAYDNDSHKEIYRYAGGQIDCVSCDPGGAPASGDALLQAFAPEGITNADTLVPNITDDGQRVFFESPDRLLPEDANNVIDVYEWKAQGAGSCSRPGGCLALVSSGQGVAPSYLFGMTASGSDVFIETLERLVSSDIASGPSIYDARVNGGIPDKPAEAPCQGDSCQGQGTPAPAVPSGASAGAGGGNLPPVVKKPSCAKGKRRIKGRCVKKHHKRKSHHKKRQHRRAGHDGRARR